MRKLIFAVAMLIAGQTAQAQWGLGPEVGANLSNYTVKNAGVSQDIQVRGGGRLGVVGDFAINDNLYFQPGAYFATNGYRINLSDGYELHVLNTLDIPLNIEYKIGMLGTDRFFIGAGPYVGFNTGGFVRRHAESLPGIIVDSRRNLSVGTWPTDDIKPLDLGGNVNLGYQSTSGLFVRLKAQMGILNMMPKGNSDNMIKSTSFSLSVGYIIYKRNENGTLYVGRKMPKNAKAKHHHPATKHR